MILEDGFLSYSITMQDTQEITYRMRRSNLLSKFRFFFQIHKMGYSVGMEDLKHPIMLTKCLVAEFLGTMFLVIIGCGTASVTTDDYITKANI